jgi:hypothetical protein
VAVKTGETPTVRPSLAVPMALNCLLAPSATVVVAGLKVIWATIAADAVTATVAVSAMPFAVVAIAE